MSFFRTNDGIVTCNFPESNIELYGLLEKYGFSFSRAYDIISLKASSLLSAEGVKKILGFKEKGADVYCFKDLYPFQFTEIADFLNAVNYPITKELLLEYLLGTSDKSSQYVLTVCCSFAEAFEKENLSKEDTLIRMVGVNDSILAFLKKLIGKDYSDLAKDAVILAKGSEGNVKTDISENLINSALQHNLNEKCAWKDAESKVKQ